MQIVPFGLPSGGNEGVTIQSQDQVFGSFPSLISRSISKSRASRRRWRSQLRPGRYFSVYFLSTQSAFVCRICKGNHLAANCPNRGQEEPTPSAAVYQPKQAAKSDRYVPPNQRERSSGRHHELMCCVFLFVGQEEDDQFIVRINNVADDVDEKKLYSMLNWNYSLRRVHIPKSYDTNKPRGYAFFYLIFTLIFKIDYLNFYSRLFSLYKAKPCRQCRLSLPGRPHTLYPKAQVPRRRKAIKKGLRLPRIW